MPTTPETGSGASAAARAEAETWAAVANELSALGDLKPDPTEAAVVVYHDPGRDLERRAAAWGHRLADHRIDSIAEFAAGLALAESEAWADDRRDVAMRAYTDRRHLLADRVVHWAVPLLLALEVNRRPPTKALGSLLDIANTMSVAPAHARGEGVHAPGEDGFGPLPGEQVDVDYLRSLWSGAVLVGKNRAAAVDAVRASILQPVFDEWAGRWSDLARTAPGTAALWMDLSARAAHTARVLGADRKA